MDVRSVSERVAEALLEANRGRRGSLRVSKNNTEELAKFLFDNPNPTDDKIHAWAEKRGLDVHKVEADIYTLATKYANMVYGGRAAKKKFTREDADPKELKMGIAVEMEHTPDKDVSELIALSHLSELKDYYTRLKKMENEGEGK